MHNIKLIKILFSCRNAEKSFLFKKTHKYITYYVKQNLGWGGDWDKKWKVFIYCLDQCGLSRLSTNKTVFTFILCKYEYVLKECNTDVLVIVSTHSFYFFLFSMINYNNASFFVFSEVRTDNHNKEKKNRCLQ